MHKKTLPNDKQFPDSHLQTMGASPTNKKHSIKSIHLGASLILLVSKFYYFLLVHENVPCLLTLCFLFTPRYEVILNSGAS